MCLFMVVLPDPALNLASYLPRWGYPYSVTMGEADGTEMLNGDSGNFLGRSVSERQGHLDLDVPSFPNVRVGCRKHRNEQADSIATTSTSNI